MNQFNKVVTKSFVMITTAMTSIYGYSNEIEHEAGIVVNALSADTNRVSEDVFASFDYIATQSLGTSAWTLHIEANTDLRDNRVSGSVAGANADAGSAVDEDGNGRVQVSELFYTLPAFNGELNIGLLDATSALDGSDVANDEGGQFTVTSLVNNLTIGFPDYSLGLIYTQQTEQTQTGYSIVLMSSHGIGDNEHLSYSELVDVGDEGKGVFLAGEYNWTLGDAKWRTGVWINTADHEHLDNSNKTSDNYGIYLSTDFKLGSDKLNLRAGVANKTVSDASNFISLSYESDWVGDVSGLGISRIGASSELDNGKNTIQAEFYSRFDINDNFHLTPSLRWIKNGGLGQNNSSDNKVTIAGIRASYTF